MTTISLKARLAELWAARWPRVAVTLVAVVVAIAAIMALYRIPGTGFGGHYGPDGAWHPAKTLWDWMELLIIPLVLAGGAAWFNGMQNRRQRAAEGRRAEIERQIETDRFREAALQAYIDRIERLLIDYGLRSSEPGSEVRDAARARTLTVLRRLDGERRGTLLRFLHQSGLVAGEQPAIGLHRADLGGAYVARADLSGDNLSGAILRQAYLETADLSRADLSQADLQDAILVGAKLAGANLSRAKLSGADLSRADLTGANLSGARVTPEQLAEARTFKGATLPDGRVHENGGS
jgi:uncharacterized protein YjbI with pentapeptide repeats